jgi:competence protein ComEA
MLVAAALLGWRFFAYSRWSTRPTTLSSDAAAFQVELNHADHAMLLQLPGVGETLATRIEATRREQGGFRDLSDLRRVTGVGPAMLERLRPFVYVEPVEPDADFEAPKSSGPPAASAVKKALGSDERVDVNQATAEQLQKIPGVGPSLAGKIVAAREKRRFTAVEDLRRVPGLGVKTLEKLRPHVTVGEPESERDGGG